MAIQVKSEIGRLKKVMLHRPGKELVMKVMSGVRDEELKIRTKGPLASLLNTESQFLLDPIPNLYFTRDPFASIGNGVSLNCMYSRTRRRETIFGEYILKYHTEFAGQTPFYYDRKQPYSIEGGDICIWILFLRRWIMITENCCANRGE